MDMPDLNILRNYRSKLLQYYDVAIYRGNKNYMQWLEKTINELSQQIFDLMKENKWVLNYDFILPSQDGLYQRIILVKILKNMDFIIINLINYTWNGTNILIGFRRD